MKNFFIFPVLLISSIILHASPTNFEPINEAVYVAQVKSFTTDGYLNCEFQCFLDMNYSNFEVAPTLYFQVGTSENPFEYKNIKLDEKFLTQTLTEKVFNSKNYKLKLNIGKIAVKRDFIARIVIVQGNEVIYVYLDASNFNNSLTIMNAEQDAEEKGLCKAEQFLRKINFDRLYDDYTYVLK